MSKPHLPRPAELRLQQSRERIRQWLTHEDEEPEEQEGAGLGIVDHVQSWMKELREHSMLSSAFNAAQIWWESHPWRPATHLAGGLFRQALLPVANKHPLALVLVAATVGGSLVWFRPGRGIVKAVVLKGVVSQSLLGLVKQPFIGSLANQFITWMHKRPSGSAPSTP